MTQYQMTFHASSPMNKRSVIVDAVDDEDFKKKAIRKYGDQLKSSKQDNHMEKPNRMLGCRFIYDRTKRRWYWYDRGDKYEIDPKTGHQKYRIDGYDLMWKTKKGVIKRQHIPYNDFNWIVFSIVTNKYYQNHDGPITIKYTKNGEIYRMRPIDSVWLLEVPAKGYGQIVGKDGKISDTILHIPTSKKLNRLALERSR